MITIVVIQQYTFVKTYQIAVLKLVNFIVCKLYLNKADKKNLCKNSDSFCYSCTTIKFHEKHRDFSPLFLFAW